MGNAKTTGSLIFEVYYLRQSGEPISSVASGSNQIVFISMISLRSPFGGRPIREWTLWREKGEENVKIEEGGAVVTPESYYCLHIGYLDNGQKALIKDVEGYKLFKILEKHYRQ